MNWINLDVYKSWKCPENGKRSRENVYTHDVTYRKKTLRHLEEINPALRNSSWNPDKTVSTMENSEPKPNVIIIIKKRIAHKGDTGMFWRASGYTTKANPGPACE